MIWRPASPGMLVCLAATVCLAVVTFSVPWFKAIWFLQATISQDNVQGTATFGVLGYCFEAGGNVACSNATVGWEFDPNQLLGIDLPLNIEIPNVVVKWLTYVLVLHIVALCLAAVATVFGILAHIREMAMTTFSSCISGIAAGIALLAFIFDLVFFFVVRARIRAIGGQANIGSAMWLTLAAWLLLFFAGCFYGFGRCCMGTRPRGPRREKAKDSADKEGGITHSEAMRMDAIKAEQERKARKHEIGLPAFPTGAESEVKPLRKPEAQYYVEEDSEDENRPYKPAAPLGQQSNQRPQPQGGPYGARRQGSGDTGHTGRTRQQSSHQFAGGYVQGPPGGRSMDVYNNNVPPAFPASPPLPNNLPFIPEQAPTRQPNRYPPNNYGQSASPPPMPVPPSQSYLAAPVSVGQVFPGHGPQQSSYHSAVSHQQGLSSYSQYDPPTNDPYGAPRSYADPYAPAVPPSGYPEEPRLQNPYSQPPLPPLPPQGQPSYGNGGYGTAYGDYSPSTARPQPPPLTTTPSPYGGVEVSNWSSQPYTTATPANQTPVLGGVPRPGTAGSQTGGGYNAYTPPPMPNQPRTPIQAVQQNPPIPPWNGGGGPATATPPPSSGIPLDSPPGYDAGGANSTNYPREKR